MNPAQTTFVEYMTSRLEARGFVQDPLWRSDFLSSPDLCLGYRRALSDVVQLRFYWGDFAYMCSCDKRKPVKTSSGVFTLEEWQNHAWLAKFLETL